MCRLEIQTCQFCGMVKKTTWGKYHGECWKMIYRLKQCLPENVPWVKAEIKDKYGITVSDEMVNKIRGVE